MTSNQERAAEVHEVLENMISDVFLDSPEGVAANMLAANCTRAMAEHEPPLLAPNLTNITRLTVAGGGRRQLEEWAIHDVELSIQDNGRTLKVFYRKDAAHAEKENES